VDVEEDPATVTLTLTALRESRNDCADGRVVDLERPLGDRTVIDISTAEEVEVHRSTR
jgi:hypothetical protein